MIQDALAVLLAYLLGSLPFAYLVTRYRTGLDIRQVGEGNAGARNVWHVVGPGWGALVGALDVGKGFAAYQAAQYLGVTQAAVLLSGFAVVLGHGFPLLRWGQGGKGVAAGMGFLLGLVPRAAALGGLAFGLVYLWRHDFNISIAVACTLVILAPLAFGQPVLISGYILALMLTMGIKKLMDRPHEQEVWARTGWTNGAVPGFHGQPEENHAATPEE